MADSPVRYHDGMLKGVPGLDGFRTGTPIIIGYRSRLFHS